MAHIPKADRTKQLLSAALKLAERIGWSNLTRDGIAAEAGCNNATVTQTLGTMVELRRSVMRHAVAEECLAVVAEGLARGAPAACKAPERVKRKAAALVRNAVAEGDDE
jgi:AcrR family transcriptional regulator